MPGIGPGTFALAAGVGVLLCLVGTGCGQRRPTDANVEQAADIKPEVSATLAQLTRELRKTMPRQKLDGSFEQFAALRSDLTIPPPPDGKKYAISKKWKVILVDR
jgi:hypothetical protein